MKKEHKDNEVSVKGRKERFLYAKFQKSNEIPFMILFLIKNHIVKDEDGARRLLLTIILIIFVVSLLMFTKCYSSPVFIDRIR